MFELKFPKDFLWGAATSAHQVEGGNHNDWTEWEKLNAVRLSKASGGKYPPENYISGRACDHYSRFREDFDIAKSLGHNAHRFSIEWSRIEPEEGKFNEKEIEHYREVIRALRERGMEPFVTLWHWAIPIWMRDKGGVSSKEFPRYFARFSKHVVSQLPEVKFWMTLNEPTSVLANSYLKGIWPPQQVSISKLIKASKILASAHNSAYDEIKKIRKDSQIGIGHVLKYQEPFSRSILDRSLTKLAQYLTNSYMVNATIQNTDWVGLQYYFHERLKFDASRPKYLFLRVENENKWVNDIGWEIYPEGIYHLLRRLARYKKPIYITENGIADARDVHRERFIKEHLEWVAKAIQEGVDVRSYFYWSLLDNFEWDKGFWPRFGLVEVDYKTLERKIRPSAWKYKEIIEKDLID